jgi:hypothetical protein
VASDACEQGGRNMVVADHVRVTGEAILRSLRRHRIGSYYKEVVLDFLRPDERAALYHALEGTKVAGASAGMEQALTNLELLGLITRDEGNWRVQGTLLEAWLNRNRPNE